MNVLDSFLNRDFTPDLNHMPSFKTTEGMTPLSQLTNQKLATKDIQRIRFLAGFFSSFHLKNMVIENVNGRLIKLDGQKVINFASANYLGLDQHKEVKSEAAIAVQEWGTHSGCSRMFASHENIFFLENEISNLVQSEKTLIGANTSQTHIGVVEALFASNECSIFIDKHAHTSMYQAAQVAKAKGAKLISVNISDTVELTQKLKSQLSKHKVLMIDGLYSMSGEIPNLNEIQRICNQNGTILYVDDAHGIGILGENGGGVVEQFGLNFDNLILIGGLQKGLCSYGGFVSGHGGLIDYLRVKSKSYVFSGTLQPHAVSAALKAISICKSGEGRVLRHKLMKNSVYIREQLLQMGFDVLPGNSPIISVKVGADMKTLMAGRKLYDEGVYVNSVLYPAVEKGHGILRISLTAIHESSDIECLLECFKELKKYWDENNSPIKLGVHYVKEIAKSKIQGAHYQGL